MTNADKYLKEEVDKEQFYLELATYSSARCIAYDKLHNCKVYENFFETEVKPILTEDERVILRNIDKKFIKIARDDRNSIYFIFKDNMELKYYANVFDNIFQFIKERRRILNTKIIRR